MLRLGLGESTPKLIDDEERFRDCDIGAARLS